MVSFPLFGFSCGLISDPKDSISVPRVVEEGEPETAADRTVVVSTDESLSGLIVVVTVTLSPGTLLPETLSGLKEDVSATGVEREDVVEMVTSGTD